jgi:hypothetical protein
MIYLSVYYNPLLTIYYCCHDNAPHQALAKNKTLKGLNLRQNNLGIVGGEALVRCFTSGANTTLKMLCLADNKIGVDNFAIIAATLRSSVGNIVRSCCGHELELPEKYDPSRDPLIKVYK